jgi:hypothetical protein
VPDAGVEHLDDATAKSKRETYLFDELRQRVANAPIRFKTQIQVARDGDIVDDATIHWPADRPLVQFGDLELTTQGIRGKYHHRAIEGTNLALIEPDLAKVFPISEAVNRALRVIADAAQGAQLRRTRRPPRLMV